MGFRGWGDDLQVNGLGAGGGHVGCRVGAPRAATHLLLGPGLLRHDRLVVERVTQQHHQTGAQVLPAREKLI